jgi:DNA cross-link repair 1B protein
MFLFQGYMGTILHTGDMRFREEMILNNPILYPLQKRTPNNVKCSIHIDELIFDNTYLNPVFNFPTRDKACKMMMDIIEKNRGKRCIIAMGTLGKEEMMLHLSEYF